MNDVVGGGKFLRSGECNPPILVTMSLISQEEVGQEQEEKYVVWFGELEKGLVLNKINADTISQIVGSDDSDAWIGKQIVLFQTETDYAGKRVPCIRVRAPKKIGKPGKPVDEGAAQAAMQQQNEEPFGDDDVPF